MAYAPALARQREVHAQVFAGDAPPTVLLVEHDPVITVSKRKAASQHLLAGEEALRQLGIDVQPTDRGGDITYHGPGQLVAYPIVRLAPLGLSISRYMRVLEEVAIETLAAFGIEGVLDACATGVWVWEAAADRGHETTACGLAIPEAQGHQLGFTPSPQPSPPERGEGAGAAACGLAGPGKIAALGKIATFGKIAALGVRVSRGISLHGLALNVAPDLRHFQTIVPCGLVGRTVTSMAQVLGSRVPAMAEVKAQLARAMERHLAGKEESSL